MELYNRRENESFMDWKARLIIGKLDKTIDLDWIEIVEMLGLECSGDHLRKTAYGFREAYDFYNQKLEDKTEDSDILSELDARRIEFEKEKMRFQDQRREFSKLIRYEARYEHLKNEFIDAIKDTENIVPVDFTYRQYKPSEKEGVLLIGDWHVGLNVNNYWNTYSMNEFFRRINKLTDKVIENGRLHNIKKLNVIGLGDFVNGLIHISTRLANEEDVVQQTKIVAETIGKMLIKFASQFQLIDYYMVTGNHGRVSPNKKESLESENFEEFVMWYLEVKLQGVNNIKLMDNVVDDGIIVADILGYTCFGVHGDKDRISNAVQNLSLMLKTVPDYVFTADKHHLEENEIHGIEVIINRSLSGVDQYAKDIRKTSYAGQSFMIFDKDIGRECTYNIKLN